MVVLLAVMGQNIHRDTRDILAYNGTRQAEIPKEDVYVVLWSGLELNRVPDVNTVDDDCST